MNFSRPEMICSPPGNEYYFLGVARSHPGMIRLLLEMIRSRPGGALVCPGRALVCPGGALVCPGGALVCPGVNELLHGITRLLHEIILFLALMMIQLVGSS